MSSFKQIWLKKIYTEEDLKNRLKEKFKKLAEGGSCQFFIDEQPKYLHKINGKAKISDHK